MDRRAASSWIVVAVTSLALACSGGGSSSTPGGGGGGGGSTWAKAYARPMSSPDFLGFAAVQGGYVATAVDVRTVSPYDNDAWVMKVDASGNRTWEVELSTTLEDTPTSVAGTPDGGCVVAGGTWDPYVLVPTPWLVKLDGTGAIAWQEKLDADASQSNFQFRDAFAVRATSDGGLVAAGSVTEGTNSPQGWILKLSSTGGVAWQLAYGDQAAYLTVYQILSIEQTSDGGYVAVGWRGFGLWVLKVSSTGAIAWQRALENASPGAAYAVRETSDGGFAVAGYRSDASLGHEGALVVKLSSAGTVQWQRFYSSATASASAYDLVALPDGSLVVAGAADSMAGGAHAWLMKTDSTGGILWQRELGTGSTWAEHLVRTSDGHLVVAAADMIAQVGSDGTITFSAGSGAVSQATTFAASDGGLVDVTDAAEFGSHVTSYVAGDAGLAPSVPTGTTVTTLAP